MSADRAGQKASPRARVRGLSLRAYCFEVPNPFGVCTVGRVAVFATSRTAAIQKIKDEGLRVERRALGSPVTLTRADLAELEADQTTVWIRGTGTHINGEPVNHDRWHPVAQFRARYEQPP